MRYTVGTKVPFISIQFTTNGKPGKGTYLPWDDVLVGITIRHMLCKEHHKVQENWDPENRLCHDGFIFDDQTGGLWNNQYPRAYYGQLDDRGDWMISRNIEVDGKRHVENMSDLAFYLENLLLGIKEIGGRNDGSDSAEKVEALRKHLKEVTDQYESSTGWHVEVYDPYAHDPESAGILQKVRFVIKT